MSEPQSDSLVDAFDRAIARRFGEEALNEAKLRELENSQPYEIRIVCNNSERHKKGQPVVWVQTFQALAPYGDAEELRQANLSRWSPKIVMTGTDSPGRQLSDAEKKRMRRDVAEINRNSAYLVDNKPANTPTKREAVDLLNRGIATESVGTVGRIVYTWKCRRCGDSLSVREELINAILDRAESDGLRELPLSEMRAIMQK